jgi:hypothetical protein
VDISHFKGYTDGVARDSGPDGIQMSVANKLQKIRVAIHDHRFVTPLEQVTGTVLSPVHPSGIAEREILLVLGEGLVRHMNYWCTRFFIRQKAWIRLPKRSGPSWSNR